MPRNSLSCSWTRGLAAGDAAGLGEPGAVALVPAGGRHPGLGHRAGRASHRHVRRRQEEAAVDRHSPVRQRRGRLSRLQRNVAAAADPWRRVLPQILERGHVAAGPESCPGGEQTLCRQDRSTAIPGRSASEIERHGRQRAIQSPYRKRGARRQAHRRMGASGRRRAETGRAAAQPGAGPAGAVHDPFRRHRAGQASCPRDRSGHAKAGRTGPSRRSARRSSGRPRSATRGCRRQSPRRARSILRLEGRAVAPGN